ncbi:MAG: 3-isopropylmalate dehydratase large subunit, partial [Planctomycetota bacterium]
IEHFYDVIDDPNGRWTFDADAGPDARLFGSRYGGVCHSALPERGHCVPGEVLVGADSHTCTAGAFGQFATGIGSTDAAFAMGTGKILLRVPETMRFVLTGQLPDGVMAKDAILHIIGQTGVDGATYRAMEFAGDGITNLSIEDRMTIANMVIEAGAKNGIFPADQTTRDFVDAACAGGGTTRPYECPTADADAAYISEMTVDLSALEPVVAQPPDPSGLATVRDCADVAVNRVYIGSCTGGKISDFDAFAKIVRGRSVTVDTFGVPATPAVLEYLTTATLGEKTLWNILVDAGVRMTANPGCAACLGGPADTFGRMNEPLVCVSTTNRNFPGRMGHLEGRIYLASPATAAATALAGRIADPRDVLQ